MASMILCNDEKRSPITVYCKVKNKERLTDLLNKIVHLFEVEDKRENDFLKAKIVKEVEVIDLPYYVWLEPSNRDGNEFKSLLDCVKTNDTTTLSNHFKNRLND